MLTVFGSCSMVRLAPVPCNNSWMSDLESENKPHIRAMMRDISITLEPKQQQSLSRWAILKAMVLEVAPKKQLPFYAESENAEIVPPSTFIPVATFAWIGRLSIGAFHAGEMETFGAWCENGVGLQQGGSNRSNRRNLTKLLHRPMLLALPQEFASHSRRRGSASEILTRSGSPFIGTGRQFCQLILWG